MFYPPTPANAWPRPTTSHSACSEYGWVVEDPRCHNCFQGSFVWTDKTGCCLLQLCSYL